MHQIKIESCLICSAKDKEMFHMTAHIARLTQMMAQDHETIQALKHELILERKQNDGRTNAGTERTTNESPS